MSVDLSTSTLDECEGIIERGLTTFMEVGGALLRIRDDRLYRNEYRDFETYCQNRWSMGRRRANQLIDAADITNALGTMVPNALPTSERQARELSGLDTETAAAVMTEAHKATNGKPTAAVISGIRAKFETPPEDQALTQEEREALDTEPTERPDDILTEAEWQAAADEPEPDDEPEDFSPFIAGVQKAFYTFALAEKRFGTDRIAEVARSDSQFAATLREDMTRTRRWFKQIDAALSGRS